MKRKLEKLEKASRPLESNAFDRKKHIQKVLQFGDDFLNNIDHLKAHQITDENGIGLYNYPISEEPEHMDTLLNVFQKHVNYPGINPASPGHLGYVPGGGIFPSALGDYLADVTNKYSGLFYAAPGAVRMENMLIRWMCRLAGFPPETAAGSLTSGGSMANLTAIVTARDTAKLKSKDFEKVVVYLTQQAHHSFAKALKIIGLSEAIIREVPLDENFKMRALPLKKQILSDKAQGLLPFFIYTSAGTTDAGAVDPLDEIGTIANSHKIWLHVDAAYGGFFLLCAEGKKQMKGIEKADSLIMDPHKGLFLPYGTGAVLVKEGKKLLESQHYTANYLQDAVNLSEEYSPADASPELSKHFRGLRMWLPLKLFGLAPFRAALEEKILLTRYFYEQIQKIKGLEVGPYPDLSIMIFRYVPEKGDPNEFNERLVREIQDDGRIFLSSTRINGIFYIRLAILNFRTHLKTIDLALEIIRKYIGIIVR